MPAGAFNMLSSLVSPFPEVDADISKDLASRLARVSVKNPRKEQSSTHSSCPVNLNDDGKDRKNVQGSAVSSVRNPWRRDLELPASNTQRLIPFQADRSVSMIEESRKSPLVLKSSSACRYKTELCRSFLESSTCKYGDKCQFAHGPTEVRGMIRHPKYKTELCRTYHTVGFCPYGSRCHFIHDADEQRFSSRGQRPPLLRQSISCSGIQSSSSSSISLFSSSCTSSMTSLSPFSPTSPVSPIGNTFVCFESVSPASSPIVLGLPFFTSPTPSHIVVENPMTRSIPVPHSAWESPEEPTLAEKQDSPPRPESAEDSSKCLPIFNFLSDDDE